MKSEQLKNQSQLLEVQEELMGKQSDQLEAVKVTVDDKLSWASVVEKNSGKAMAQKVMKKAVKSAIEECGRESIVEMFNVEEEQEEGDSSEQ